MGEDVVPAGVAADVPGPADELPGQAARAYPHPADAGRSAR